MVKMYISYADGRKDIVEYIEEAERFLEAEYPDAEYGDWQPDSLDGLRSRCLVWATEEDAEGDGDYMT